MTDNQTTELLPCPFCGGEAQVMHMDLDSIEEGWKVWGVWCVDDLNAEDYRSHGHFIDNYATEAEAIAVWNARAERTCRNTHENRWFKCSACGYGFTDLYAEDESDINEQPRYCPNCGCKAVDV